MLGWSRKLEGNSHLVGPRVQRRYRLIGTASFAGIVVVAGILFLFYVRARVTGELRIAEVNESVTLELQQTLVNGELERLFEDAIYLQGQSSLQRLVRSDFDPERGESLAAIWGSFLTRRRNYRSLSVMGLDGRELYRVDYGSGSPYRVAEERLRDLSATDFYTAAIAMRPDEILLTSFDAVSDEASVTSIKPVARVALTLPAPDGDDPVAKVSAVLVLEYLGDALLDVIDLASNNSAGDLLLFNTRGIWYYINGSGGGSGWTFASGTEAVDVAGFPENIIELISSEVNGQFRLESGLLTFSGISMLRDGEFPSPASGTRYRLHSTTPVDDEGAHTNCWKLVSFLPSKALRARGVPSDYLLFGLALTFLIAAAGFLTRTRLRRLVAEEENRRLFIAIEQSANAIAITDPKGNLEFVNRAFENSTGYSREEVLGENPRILKGGALKDEDYEKLWRTISSGQPWHGEFHNRRKDGSTYWEEAVITPIKDRSGKIINYLSVKENITPRKEVETALVEAKEAAEKARRQAEEANRLKTEFLANMSHEIRTPMNAIIGFTELLIDEISDEEVLNRLRVIRNAGDSLLSIINDILDFSRIESNRLKIERVPFRLHDMIARLEEMFVYRAREKGLELRIHIGDGVPKDVVGDELRLNQILLNILSNAFKFTAEGGVTFSCTYDSHVAIFKVEDTGIGIESDTLKKIFLAFEQGDSSTERRFGGTGLGLAISQKLAHMMDGQLFAHSRGRGSTFTLILPLPPVDAETEAQAAVHPVENWIKRFDEDDTRRIAVRALSELPDRVRDLGEAIRRLDRQLIGRIGHEMRGMYGNLKMFEVERLCEEIEIAAGSRDTADTQIQHLYVRLREIAESLPEEYQAGTAAQGPIATREEAQIQMRDARILTAEDNMVNQELVEAYLRGMGLESDFVSNGQEALAKLQESSYTLLLLDIQMPVMSGEELLAVLQGDAAYDGLYIIALTAHALKGDQERYLELGCDDYIAKPIDRKDFEAKILSALGQAAGGPGHDDEAGTVGGGGSRKNGGSGLNDGEIRLLREALIMASRNLQLFRPEQVSAMADTLARADLPLLTSLAARLRTSADEFDDQAFGEVVREMKNMVEP